ncbi:hypothetical protein KFE25_003465 [Diacronema lutheri]|uniref:1-alkyl-2-acetylglycerophosphocholine esterase n=1 Tax=Diacronema lutheri TaxID=2081491 RepID=A0A8J5XMD9_DIALT|nr:hypothetical protein KFE25_003465 [Diacronema lutheri]
MPALASLPAELALVGVVGASLLGVHPLAAPAALACVTTKLVLERALRWQATPAALALAIGQLPHGAWLAWPLLMLALALVVAIPQPSGPPPFTGPYAVGFIDAQLLVGDVPLLVRALYPVSKLLPAASRRARYFSVDGRRVCSSMTTSCGPPPLNRHAFSFILDHLCLVRAPICQGGPHLPLGTAVPPPVVVFAHGLSSTREQYLGIVGELASRGLVVLCIEHTNRTAMLARFPDGAVVTYSTAEAELERVDPSLYEHTRRLQLEYQSVEFVAALDAARALGGEAGAPELGAGPRDVGGAARLLATLSGRIDGSALVAAGHSMGAVTAAVGAVRAPVAVRACVLLDPTTDWLPDDASRAALIGEAGARIACSPHERQHRPLLPTRRSLDATAVLTLISEDWRHSRPSVPRLLRAHAAAHGHGPGSEFAYVAGMHHVGHSDIPSLLPPALARALNFLSADVDAQQACLRVRSRVVHFLERLGLCQHAPCIGAVAAATAREADERHLLELLVLPLSAHGS